MKSKKYPGLTFEQFELKVIDIVSCKLERADSYAKEKIQHIDLKKEYYDKKLNQYETGTQIYNLIVNN